MLRSRISARRRRAACARFLLPLGALRRIEITDCGLASGQSPALVALEPRHVAHQIGKDGRQFFWAFQRLRIEIGEAPVGRQFEPADRRTQP